MPTSVSTCSPAGPAPRIAHGWTPALQARFLDHLAARGNARAACRSVGLSAEAAYRLRRRDPLFARGWAAALLLARESGTQVLAERAIDGVEEQIYYRGELVGTRRRYDSRLLLAHLARLDRLADEATAGADAARFDELLVCIADGSDAELPPERERFVEEAACTAEQEHRSESLDVCAMDAVQGAETDLDDEYLNEFLEALDEECRDVAERAGKEAGKSWDCRRSKALLAVDTLCGRSGAPVAAGLPGNPFHPPPAPSMPGTQGLPFPGTVSTVSTCALANLLHHPDPSSSSP